MCNWDEKGPQKVYKALKDEVTIFIKQVQEVHVHRFWMSNNVIHCASPNQMN